MRASRRIPVLVALTALVASVVTTAPASAAPIELIQGSGSVWAANAVNQWIASVQPSGLQVVYTEDGSLTGKQDFAHHTSDFAITDLPYPGYYRTTGALDTSQGRDYGAIPIAAGAITFPYQLKICGKQFRRLRLSGHTLAKIFTDRIKNWDNHAITVDNNGVELPSMPIIPVVLAGVSDVTYEVTSYLAARYPKIWETYSGTSAPLSVWPPAPSRSLQIAQNGSDGLMNYVSSKAANGAIGMVEDSYARSQNYPVASLENKAGYFVQPSPYDVAIALRRAKIDENPADADYMRPHLRRVFTAPDKRAYPLSTFSSMLIPTSPTDSSMTTAKRQTLAEFAYYDICRGQQNIGAIGYAPLPLNLVKAGFAQIDRLKAADPLVDLTGLKVSTCVNPTFLDHHLKRHYLGSIAPEPPACAKRGQGPCAGGTFACLLASAGDQSAVPLSLAPRP